MKTSLIVAGCLFGFAVFAGCGGSSGSSDGTQTWVGQFIDSPVEGLKYSCGELSGKTDSTGEFTCKDVPITFSVGSLQMGKLNKFTSDHKVYPQDIIGVDRTNFTDEKLISLVRMLQSLDDDGNTSTGIKIPDSAHTKLNGASDEVVSMSSFASMLGVSMDDLVGKSDAISHLRTNMNMDTHDDEDSKESTGINSLTVNSNDDIKGYVLKSDYKKTGGKDDYSVYQQAEVEFKCDNTYKYTLMTEMAGDKEYVSDDGVYRVDTTDHYIHHAEMLDLDSENKIIAGVTCWAEIDGECFLGLVVESIEKKLECD